MVDKIEKYNLTHAKKQESIVQLTTNLNMAIKWY